MSGVKWRLHWSRRVVIPDQLTLSGVTAESNCTEVCQVILLNKASISDLSTSSVTFWSTGNRKSHSLKEIYTDRVMLLSHPSDCRSAPSPLRKVTYFSSSRVLWSKANLGFPVRSSSCSFGGRFSGNVTSLSSLQLRSTHCKRKQPNKQENSAVVKIIQILIKFSNACFMNNKGCNWDVQPFI